MTRGVMKMISSVRAFDAVFVPKAAPTTGIRLRNGIPDETSVSDSLMMSASAIVSPSCTVTCVCTVLVAKLGDEMLEVVVGCGALTFWLIAMVTTPLAFTYGVIFSDTPVLLLPIVFEKTELP